MADRRYSARRGERDGVQLVELADSACGIAATVAPALGGELASLRWRGIELLDRALEFEEPPRARWRGRAPVLWPAVGRQRGGEYTWEGATRPMPLHGFAQRCAFELAAFGVSDEGSGEDASAFAVVRLRHAAPSAEAAAGDGGAWEAYPFPATLTITYRLHGGRLELRHEVRNEGDTPLPFALGSHLTLRFPFIAGARGASEEWAAGRIRSSLTHEYLLTAGSLLSGETRKVEQWGGGEAASGLPLSEPCATNAVFGFAPAAGGDEAATTATACWLEIEQPGTLAVRVQHQYVQADASEAARVNAGRHFVLWGEAPASAGEGGFLCPEPWLSGPDSFNTRVGLAVLPPREVGTWTAVITARS